MFDSLTEMAREVFGSVLPSFYDPEAKKAMLLKHEAELAMVKETVSTPGWKVIDAYLQIRQNLATDDIVNYSRPGGTDTDPDKVTLAHARLNEIKALRAMVKTMEAELPRIQQELFELLNRDDSTQ